MAASITCEKLICQSFPHIDEQVKEYINGILETGSEEFETNGDVFDAIGDMLLGVDLDKSENDIRAICDKLYNILKVEENGNDALISESMRRLNEPVHLGSAAENMIEKNEDHSANIWIVKKDNVTMVDQKKLEKAEAKLKQKKEKRSVEEGKPTQRFELNSATASQQTNRRDAKLDASGTNKSYDIRIENFDVAFGEKVLLSSADLHLVYGRRYGLVGRNGIGKTTLLKMIADKKLQIPSHISILHVEQEVVGDDTKALDSVLECDVKRAALLKEEKELSASLHSSSGGKDDKANTRLAEVYHELEHIEADKAPAKAAMILAGLGFTPDMQKMSTREFSGGWRMRLALARALFTLPDLLLLDEPTNMLDMKAIIWLENYLQNWPSTLFVVSHDRSFLNSVVTDVIHLRARQLTGYRGDFETFVKTKDERLKNQQREYEAQKQQREHIQVFIDRFRYNANRAALVQSKIKMLEKLPELTPVEKESEVILRLPECDKLSPPIIQLDEVGFYYSKDKPIFENVCVNATMDSRVCIVGENGTGKTTLLKILLGMFEPVSGLRHVHRNLRIGYFNQHHVDQMDMDVTSVEVLQSKLPGNPTEYYRQQLGSFGISGDLAMRPVVSLSGGQKSRVAFAQMCLSRPNFFILDEPTNHLDMETIEALGKALRKFQGGVILVSHDERLIHMVCEELWVCGNKTVKTLEGGIEEYKKIVKQELAAQS